MPWQIEITEDACNSIEQSDTDLKIKALREFIMIGHQKVSHT